MYLVVSYTRAHGHVIRPGLTLVEAYHLVGRLGHGAVFRSEGMSAYSRPVYPVLPGRPGAARADASGPRINAGTIAASAAARGCGDVVRPRGRVA